jgi:hypothetical protein
MPQVEYSLKANDGLTLYGLNWLPEGEPRVAKGRASFGHLPVQLSYNLHSA